MRLFEFAADLKESSLLTKMRKNIPWADEIDSRKERLRELCKKFDVSDGVFDTAAFVIMDELKLFVCTVPKAGSTTLKKTLPVISGKYYHVKLGLAESDYFNKYAGYHKAMFVRHPLERLVSGYRNKVLVRKGNFKENPDNIKKAYRTNVSEEMDPDVTFNEFLRYFVEYPHNLHWESYGKICKPCTIKYDFIGRYETYERDLATLLMMYSNLTYSEAKSEVLHRAGSKGNSSAELATKYMNNAPQSLRDQVYQLLKNDFNLFDYKFEW